MKLDPRTGEQKEYLYPDPRNGNHEVLIDRDGIIWLPEHRGQTGDKEKRLLGFDPKTEQFEYQIRWTPTTWFATRRSSCSRSPWTPRATSTSAGSWGEPSASGTVPRTTYRSIGSRPPHAIPYGVVADRNDNIWIALWSGGKIVKFDTSNNSWTEFTAPTYPGHTRRLNVDSQNNIWWGIYSAGKRPGRLVKLDQVTGQDDRVDDPAAERATL